MDNFILVTILIVSLILIINRLCIIRKEIENLGIHLEKFTPKYLYTTLPEYIVTDFEIALYFLCAFITSLALLLL